MSLITILTIYGKFILASLGLGAICIYLNYVISRYLFDAKDSNEGFKIIAALTLVEFLIGILFAPIAFLIAQMISKMQ